MIPRAILTTRKSALALLIPRKRPPPLSRRDLPWKNVLRPNASLTRRKRYAVKNVWIQRKWISLRNFKSAFPVMLK